MYGYLAAAGLALMILVGVVCYEEGKQAGADKCASQRSVQADKVQTAIDLRDQSSATARVDMLDYLRVTVPPIEIKTYETVERIRTVYKDRVITADCAAAIARPDRVRDEINAARERANTAVSAMRRTIPVTSAADPRPAGHGSVGGGSDGTVRDRSYPATGYERMPGWIAGIGSD